MKGASDFPAARPHHRPRRDYRSYSTIPLINVNVLAVVEHPPAYFFLYTRADVFLTTRKLLLINHRSTVDGEQLAVAVHALCSFFLFSFELL